MGASDVQKKRHLINRMLSLVFCVKDFSDYQTAITKLSNLYSKPSNIVAARYGLSRQVQGQDDKTNDCLR
ncbi:hypothetical protein GJ496_006956 [Pomphorhynchus laevis]|nr:hypothetical protein GJ496_006956 [Pomphorhynchus laevis]